MTPSASTYALDHFVEQLSHDHGVTEVMVLA
jgi:hypothetical protein